MPNICTAIVLNLVRNAAEALCRPGKNGSIAVHAAREAGGCRSRLATRGRAFPKAMRERLFQPFATAARTRRIGPGPCHRARSGARPWRRYDAWCRRRRRHEIPRRNSGQENDDELGSGEISRLRRRTHAAGGASCWRACRMCARARRSISAAGREIPRRCSRRAGRKRKSRLESSPECSPRRAHPACAQTGSGPISRDGRRHAPYDVVFSNATYQWLPNHAALLPRLMRFVKAGGTFAFQVPSNFNAPSHALMREVAESGAWAAKLANVREASVLPAEAYYDILAPLARIAGHLGDDISACAGRRRSRVQLGERHRLAAVRAGAGG